MQYDAGDVGRQDSTNLRIIGLDCALVLRLCVTVSLTEAVYIISGVKSYTMRDKRFGLASLPDRGFRLRRQPLSGREANPQHLSLTSIC